MEQKAKCRQCGTPTNETSNGLCPTCYMRWYCGFDKKPNCECCGFGDQRMLVRRRLDRVNWTTLCGNCAALAGKSQVKLEQLIDLVFPAEDRRKGTRRTTGDRRHRVRRDDDDMRTIKRGTLERRKSDQRTG